MKKLKPILLIVALLTSAGYSFAQDYRPGFIISPGGDTTAGFVSYRVDRSNQRTCYFKGTRHGKVTIYKPVDLRGYGYSEDKYYESHVMDVGKGKVESRFLEVLVKGNASLLKYDDQFYFEKDSLILLPRPEGQLINRNGNTYMIHPKTYVGLLNIALRDCELSADQTDYLDKSLTYLILNYNRCKGQAGIVFKQKLEWVKFTPYIFGGIDNAHLQLTQFGPMQFNTSNSPVYGAGFNLSSPRVYSRTLISVELWYTKKIYQGYSEVSDFGGVTRQDLYINTDLLKVPVSFVYLFTHASSTPYVDLGFVQYVTLHPSVRMITETENGGIVTTSHEIMPKPSKNPMGLFAGVGYQRNVGFGITCFAEVRYERNNGYAEKATGATSAGQTLNLLFGLKF